MNGSVTLSVRSIVATGAVLVGLVVAYLLGGAGGGSAPANASVQQPAAAERRTLTMGGTGEATVVPDQLGFSVSVALTRTDLDTALRDANTTMERVLGSLGRHGVARKDVQTTGLSMDPVYDYHAYSPPTIRGYRVSQRASVLVRELTEGGAAVSAAVAAGGNAVRVGDIRLEVGDPEAGMRRARAAAVATATAKAREYAEATGQELGDVVTLREVSASPQGSARSYRELRSVRGTMDTAPIPALPVRSGRDQLRVTVQVVWEFA
jgi:uncharacterized protein YggE